MKLSKSNWDNIFTAIEEVTAAAEENEMPAARTSFPIVSHARQDMTDMYAQLQHTGELKLYGAAAIASSSSNNNAPAAGSTEVPPPLLQEILGLPVSALTPSPTNTLLWAGVAVAVLEGLISLATGVSLNALVLTTLVLVSADRLFLNGAVSESLLKFLAPDIQTKILKHEAGHFLAAYLLGCPVEGTVLSAWAALRDRRFGSRGMISAGTSFFDPELSQQINSSGGSSNGRVTQSSVSRYSIIVMAGIAAEAEHYGQADGGAGDEMALIAFLSRLSNWNGDSQRIRNQARWGVLQAVLLLRQYRPAYDALVDALEQGGNLGDCLYAVERAARQHNLPGAAERQPLGYIVPAKDGRLTWSPTTTGGGDASITAGNNNNDTNHNHNNSEELSFQKQVEVVAAVTPPTPTTAPAPGLVIDQAAADALQTLHEYKLQVEQKLRDVEEKLKRNQQ